MKQLIKNANVFDGFHAELKENAKIIIEDNLVKEIVQCDVCEQEFDVVIDAKGHTVIPGLSDAHVHLFGGVPTMQVLGMRLDEIAIRTSKLAEEMLMHGFTTVRDAGSGVTYGLKQCIDAGVTPGPRIYPSHGTISQTCGHGDARTDRSQTRAYNSLATSGLAVVADGVAAVQKAVREQLFLGASQIKLMAGGGIASMSDPLLSVQYSLEELKAAVNAAKDYGTYVMIHVYTSKAMQRAAEAGVMSFEHATLLDEETARIVKDKGIWLVPGPQFADVPMMAKNPNLPPHIRQKALLAWQGEQQQTELIQKYNLNILFGTDATGTPADTVKRMLNDLGIYKKRFGDLEALRAATGKMNELIKLCTYQNPYPDGKIGVLEAGSYADLLIVNGNPVKNFELLTNPENMLVIMKDGRIYKNNL